LSVKLVPTMRVEGCWVVSATDPHDLGFPDRNAETEQISSGFSHNILVSIGHNWCVLALCPAVSKAHKLTWL
jgi:hypothetical protein